eukprot:GEMP01057984.1.p1 GENE.GEMP01057984.1~~GEMP01057984.1.p1  ORF type:complete len:190 (+),score=41.00 GEMP01057984.1:542-1111(+)
MLRLENIEELLATRLICAELRLGLKKLKRGGRLCIKLFDCLTDFTASVIWGICQAFEKVQMVKPRSSRVVNSERYLVAQDFKHNEEFTKVFIQRLDDAMVASSAEVSDIFNNPVSVTTLFPLELVHSDVEFVRDMRSMSEKLCNEQTEALKEILDALDVDLKDLKLKATVTSTREDDMPEQKRLRTNST